MKFEKPVHELLFGIGLFIIAIVTISVLYVNTLTLTAILVLGWLFVLQVWSKKNDLYFLVIGAMFGAAGEIAAIHFGAWQYANPTILGIPLWLPLAWGLATILVIRITELVVLIKNNQS